MSNALRAIRRGMMKRRGLLPSRRKMARPIFRAWTKLLLDVDAFRREALRAQKEAQAKRGQENLGKLHGELMREGKWHNRAWRKIKELFRRG